MTTSERQDRIEAEAADWLAALETGQADTAAFEGWRARDPAHAIAMLRLAHAWQRLDRLRDAPSAGATAQPQHRAALPRRRALAAAAGAVVALAAGGGLLVATQAAAQTVETTVGERRRFYITPRICLDLNTASELRWWRMGDAVEVSLLRGEVSLDLSPGAPRCTLDVGRARLQIDRGHFIARLRSAETVDVVAIAGAVRLLPRRGETGATKIPERAKLVVSASGIAAHPVSDTEIRALSAWQEGELLFDGEPLSVAVTEFNRYLPTPMVLERPAIGTVRLGGRFLTNDPTEFLKSLRLNFGIQSRSAHGGIELYR
ncbi:FecR domain-containing protein [Sphingomonas sp. R86521]|uniref:FecR family protein n=1 Tax=Sphingomonas sp. R86521 TaxID=3093860 RepID=UPI0036D3FD8B